MKSLAATWSVDDQQRTLEIVQIGGGDNLVIDLVNEMHILSDFSELFLPCFCGSLFPRCRTRHAVLLAVLVRNKGRRKAVFSHWTCSEPSLSHVKKSTTFQIQCGSSSGQGGGELKARTRPRQRRQSVRHLVNFQATHFSFPTSRSTFILTTQHRHGLAIACH